jgi:hypothetical protein
MPQDLKDLPKTFDALIAKAIAMDVGRAVAKQPRLA